MTHEQWLIILSPIIQAVVLGIAGVLGMILTGLTGKLKAYLDAKGHAQASQIVADASVRAQAAMQNAAGQIALEIQAGKLDPSDILQLKNEAIMMAESIARKIPDALAVLKPEPGSIASGILGKITTAMPTPAATATVAAPAVVAVPTLAEPHDLTGATFQARAAIVKSRLMKDLGLTDFQAAGVVGNLGQESGLQAINEIKPVAGRGGFGWAQWTGPRRIAFETWASAKGLQVTDPEANYGFLIEELRTTESAALAALKATTTLEEATQVFEQKFERAGIVSMDNRVRYATLALAA